MTSGLGLLVVCSYMIMVMKRVVCCLGGMLLSLDRICVTPVVRLLRWLVQRVERSFGWLLSVLTMSFELLVSVGRLARCVVRCVPRTVPLMKARLALLVLVTLSLCRVMSLNGRLVRVRWTLVSPLVPLAVMMMCTVVLAVPECCLSCGE